MVMAGCLMDLFCYAVAAQAYSLLRMLMKMVESRDRIKEFWRSAQLWNPEGAATSYQLSKLSRQCDIDTVCYRDFDQHVLHVCTSNNHTLYSVWISIISDSNVCATSSRVGRLSSFHLPYKSHGE
jgi:hypothetical protein